MSQQAKSTPSLSARSDLAEESAILGLDAAGRVVLANAAARKLWQAGDTELIGEMFPNLFFLEVTSREPDWLEAQWEVILAAALDKTVSLNAQPHESAHREVSVHIEKVPGTAAAYLAEVRPAAATATIALAETSGELAGLALLAEKSSLGFFDLNFKDQNVYYSRGWKKILGFADAELPNTYDTWLKLIHPEDSAAAPDRVVKKPLGGSRTFSLEFRMQHRRGHYVWIQSTGLQIFSSGGELERVLGLHLDISERKEIEESALTQEDRLQRLGADGLAGIFEIDFARNRCWFSPAWKQLCGYAPEELPDTFDAMLNALPPESVASGLENFFSATHPGQTTWMEAGQLHHKDGQWLPVLLGVHRQFSRKQELQRVVGFHVPLPAEVAAAAPAAAASSPIPLLGETFNSLAEAVIVTDPHGIILYLNTKAAQLTGAWGESAYGRPIGEIFSVAPRDQPDVPDNALERALNAEEPLGLMTGYVLVRTTETGMEFIPIVWTARQAADATGRGVVFVFRNPEELTLTPDELVQANRFESLGLLASGVAHDFNNLLTTILGGISLVKENRDYTALANSEKACLTAKGLTKQLLLFAKGGAHIKNVVAPRDILNEATRIAAAGSSVEVTVDAPEDVSPVLVERSPILQVFQNLVINAIQAMPATIRGKISLRARNVSLQENQIPPLPAGNYVEFEVRDNGAGIPPEILEKIFQPFFTTKKHGTGLGLSTVLNIVHQHGGQIGVESTVGTGTIFNIFLPVADQPVEIEARRAPTLRFGTGRILFMDDDEQICKLTASMLAGLDYKYDIARHGEEAVTLYRRYLNVGRPYDAVILDLTVIGGMGGEETFKHLHELDPDVRAIVASGYDNDEMARRFIEMGFCGYLTKPYRVNDIGKVLKTVLG